MNRDHVIDTANHPEALGRYANDATGLGSAKGIVNNAQYVEDHGKVFMEAIKDIPAGAEICISYGKEYWDAVQRLIKE